MKKRHLLFIFMTILSFVSLGQESKYDKSVSHIMSTLNCTEEYAAWVISRINAFAEQIQADIEYIANSNDSYQKKSDAISIIISKNFKSTNSKIDVSSKNNSSLTTYSIRQYLFRLAKLKDLYGYTRVELIFLPDYLGMGKFYKTSDRSYEISITMWQIFKSWFGDNTLAYEDATRKKFRLTFFVNSKNELINIKVDRIFVAETIGVDDLKKKIR